MGAMKDYVYGDILKETPRTFNNSISDYGLVDSSDLAKSLVNGSAAYADVVTGNGMWDSYNTPQLSTEDTIQGLVNSTEGITDLADTDTVFGGVSTITPDTGFGVGDWFSQNKDMLGAGIGLGQLGLGYLNYAANKKGLESDLASAEQARRLNEETAQNKRTIQGKAQSALRFA